ncbi:MAG TPA: Crp/Fnr family transcriptional regulator [Candidatus Angelobacter sp.]
MTTTPEHSATTNELYAVLSPQLRTELAKHERPATVPGGTKLIRREVLPEQLVIVNSGKVEIAFAGMRNSVSLGSTAGKVFGMRAMVSGELPEIDVTCVEPCCITTFPRDVFLALLKTNPEIYFAVAKVLSADLQIANRVLRNCSRRRSPSTFRFSQAKPD